MATKKNTNRKKGVTPSHLKDNAKALEMAVERTKEELKPKEIKVTRVTYPKGLYKRTLKRNIADAKEQIENKSKPNLKPKIRKFGAMAGTKKKSAETKKEAPKKAAPKKVTPKKAAPKKATPAKSAKKSAPKKKK